MEIRVEPTDVPAEPAYSNATFVFFGPLNEVTIAFMRIPPLSEEDGKKAQKEKRLKAHVISAVTLPLHVARSLAGALASLPVQPSEAPKVP